MNDKDREIYRKLVFKEALLQIKRKGEDPKFKISSGDQASLLAQKISNLLIGVLQAPDSGSNEERLAMLQNIGYVDLNVTADMWGLASGIESEVLKELISDSETVSTLPFRIMNFITGGYFAKFVDYIMKYDGALSNAVAMGKEGLKDIQSNEGVRNKISGEFGLKGHDNFDFSVQVGEPGADNQVVYRQRTTWEQELLKGDNHKGSDGDLTPEALGGLKSAVSSALKALNDTNADLAIDNTAGRSPDNTNERKNLLSVTDGIISINSDGIVSQKQLFGVVKELCTITGQSYKGCLNGSAQKVFESNFKRAVGSSEGKGFQKVEGRKPDIFHAYISNRETLFKGMKEDAVREMLGLSVYSDADDMSSHSAVYATPVEQVVASTQAESVYSDADNVQTDGDGVPVPVEGVYAELPDVDGDKENPYFSHLKDEKRSLASQAIAQAVRKRAAESSREYSRLSAPSAATRLSAPSAATISLDSLLKSAVVDVVDPWGEEDPYAEVIDDKTRARANSAMEQYLEGYSITQGTAGDELTLQEKEEKVLKRGTELQLSRTGERSRQITAKALFDELKEVVRVNEVEYEQREKTFDGVMDLITRSGLTALGREKKPTQATVYIISAITGCPTADMKGKNLDELKKLVCEPDGDYDINAEKSSGNFNAVRDFLQSQGKVTWEGVKQSFEQQASGQVVKFKVIGVSSQPHLHQSGTSGNKVSAGSIVYDNTAPAQVSPKNVTAIYTKVDKTSSPQPVVASGGSAMDAAREHIYGNQATVNEETWNKIKNLIKQLPDPVEGAVYENVTGPGAIYENVTSNRGSLVSAIKSATEATESPVYENVDLMPDQVRSLTTIRDLLQNCVEANKEPVYENTKGKKPVYENTKSTDSIYENIDPQITVKDVLDVFKEGDGGGKSLDNDKVNALKARAEAKTEAKIGHGPTGG